MRKIEQQFIFSKSDMAAIFGVSLTAFSLWRIEPYEKRGRVLYYYLPDVIKERGLGAQRKGTTPESANGKARIDRARADLYELELEQKRGAVVPVEAAARLLESVIVSFRLKVLGLPTKVAPLIHGCTTIPQTKVMLADELDEALAELAGLNVADLYRSTDDRAGRAAAATDIKRMGGRTKKAKPRSERRARTVAHE
jgi:hypothetical protein